MMQDTIVTYEPDVDETQNGLNEPDRKKVEEILKERAKALARVPSEKENMSGIPVLVFELADESYAICTKCIRQILRTEEITPLPHTPAFIPGVINVRGEIMSLIDFRNIFDLPERESEGATPVILVSNKTMQFGIVADKILNVVHVDPDEMLQAMPTLAGVRERYLQGIAQNGLVVLDCEKILNDEHLMIS